MTDKSKGTKGLSAFIIESTFPGFSVGKIENKMGLHGVHTSEILFTDRIVPKENLLGQEGKGFKICMQTLDVGRVVIAGNLGLHGGKKLTAARRCAKLVKKPHGGRNMKFLQFYRDGRPTLGVITEKGVVDMSAHPELPQTMLALCQSGDTAALAALDGPYLDEESLTLAPVVTGMEKILCIGLNYRAHAAECGIPLPENPTVFCKLPNALAAHGQAIALPAAEEIDYEAELVLVMGEGGRVFACTCGNDLSVREWQRASGQWLCGKTYDGFGPIGPYAVDAESLPAGGLGISCRVNGELRQHSNTSDLIFSPEELVRYLMPRIPLKAGDVIFTGTPSGVMLGYPADQKRWLRAGDTVEVTIEGIGTLKNSFQ